MTYRTFPTPTRALALAVVLIAAWLLVPGDAGARSPKEEVQHARDQLEQVEDRLARSREHLAQVQDRLFAAADQVDASEGRMEAVTAELLDVRERLNQARHHYDRVQRRLDARARSAFMHPQASTLDVFLGATSLGELADRLAFVDAVATNDASLAAMVQNLKNLLRDAQASLERLQAERRRELKQARDRKQEVQNKLAQVQALVASISDDQARAERLVKKANKNLAEWRREQAAQALGDQGAALPAGYAHVLEFCPVGEPNVFGDGFGAPRYAGGYHLHKGVDLLAASGTPIYAPFDGYAEQSSNTLGGRVVFVSGRYGRVYNAHLSGYAPKSSGPVVAGDVIGYVGDTGDATGVPHDHFEFHPSVMPSGWPVSAYGYSIIEDAVNPYPLLLFACA
jgi:murein DD-endopeptidase MepM/ murein hydrolase activator NlpD